MKRVYTICAIIACITINGCIPIKDIGPYWEKAVLDPALEGDWKEVKIAEPSQNEYFVFRKDGNQYRVKGRAVKEVDDGLPVPGDRARSIQIGSHWFLVVKPTSHLMHNKIMKLTQKLGRLPTEEEVKTSLKEAEATDKRGFLFRYIVEGDKLTVFHVKDNVISKAIKAKRLKGILPKEDEIAFPTIDKLDETTVQFLKEIADDENAWGDKKVVYQKIKSAEEDIKKSSIYPASESTDRNREVLIDLPELKHLAEGKAKVLLRHLKASPEWKVFYDGDDLVAYRRIRSGDEWTVSLNGYQSNFGSHDREYRKQTRHLFRFSEKGGGAFANKYNRNGTTFVEPTAGKVKLKLESSDQGIESYLVVGQKGLYYEFFEQRNTDSFPSEGFSKEERNELEKRKYTRAALKWIKEFLGKIENAEAEINKNGFCKELMPKGSVKVGKPTIEIKDGFQGGIFDVHAWVNPGVEGKVYLKVFDVKTGQRLSEQRLTPRSMELMGWAPTKSSTLFYYNSHITIYEGDWDTFYDARFELWVQPLDGSPERKLIETTRKINGWER